jgi:hypothetical protein
MCGARLPQAFLDDEPSQPEHAVRLSTLGVYATTSMVNSVVLSEATLRTTADSTIDSRVDSVYTGGGADVSEVTSKVESSVSKLDSRVESTVSKLDSKVDSTLSCADSKVASVVSSCDSKILSLSANDSTLDSMIDSNAIRCSTLESKALSGVFE